MTSAVDPQLDLSRPLANGAALLCPVCPHDLDNHDAVGRRYCQATQTNVLSRGCICAQSG